MYLYPSQGYALLGENFTVDIMLDTKGEQTTKAKAVIKFDPEFIRVTDARYGDLYCQYPEDEYAVDNQDGWIVLTGFCLDPYYSTSSEPELFGRFTFRPLKEGEVTLEFVTSNNTQEDRTITKDTGSPPQTMEVNTEGGTYTIVSQIQKDDGKDDEELPGVGIFDNKWIWAGLGLIGLAAAVIISGGILPKLISIFDKNNDRTIISG
jgi:hypothetical protein